ncbi:copper oxidase (plasmid) [Mesorhizobium sp. NBSH29]|uniref:cupredoxin domain-containing protein n=1 Tax=Mesorhizobium sp. NBSH29 TaxID=2654249 RepID=UPI0018968118|nr:cupredoxin family protein [Mesorhizobium sp. NBSH29]QPC88993.1 copper oxidase [Mesorhizobium sp. NBSH29]
MKKILIATAVAALTVTAALAAGKHAGGHGEEGMAIGQPAGEAKPKRTINVVMKDKSDGGMVFEPSTIAVRQGETIRLKFVNSGEQDHEFVMDTHEAVMEHKEVMAKFPEMEHDDPNAIRLKAGERGEILWTFANAGEFSFACLIPGHYESGMKGALKVSGK